MSNITQFSATIYPSKKFSIGIVPRPKKRRQDSEYDKAYEQQPDTDYGNVADWHTSKLTVGGKFCSLSENPEAVTPFLTLRKISDYDKEILTELDKVKDSDYRRFYNAVPPSEAPLLVKSLKSSRKPRGTYGSHGITKFGRRVCENACILLQQKWGKNRLGFLTATIPAVGRGVCEQLIAHWGDISRRFYQKIKRIHEKKHSTFVYVGCTEIQEKRFRDTSLAVPHLHAVYVSRKHPCSRYTVSTEQFYKAWNDAVNEVLVLRGHSPIMGTGGHRGSVKVEPIRKSASAYIGKYISKGCGVAEAMKAAGYTKFPRQWWTASMQCKKMFKEALIRLPQGIASQLFYDSEQLVDNESIAWMQRVFIDVGGYEYCVGITGKLSLDAYKFLKEEYG